MPIRVKLSSLLGARKMRVAELARRTDISQNALGRLYHEKNKGVEFETIEKVCEALECKIEDLLEYIPREK
jgi:putative transcriptional regulator